MASGGGGGPAVLSGDAIEEVGQLENTLIVYIVGQRKIIEGITLTGLTGR